MAVSVEDVEWKIGPRNLMISKRDCVSKKHALFVGLPLQWERANGHQMDWGLTELTLDVFSPGDVFVRTLGCSSDCSCITGALVIDIFSLDTTAALRLLGAVDLYSLVPLEASDLESSTIAAARWRGGAMVPMAQR